MSEIVENKEVQPGAPPEHTGDRLLINDFLGELTIREWWEKIRFGLTQPPDSGDYKFAHQEIKRLWSPVLGVVVPLLLVIVLLLMPQTKNAESTPVTITVLETKETPKLDDIKPIEEKPIKPPEIEPPKEPPPDDLNQNYSEVPGPPGTGFAGPPGSGPAGPNIPFSPQPAAFDSVAYVKSPVQFRGIYASRSPGARGSAVGRYGSGGGGGTTTEATVYRALRWLKKYQDSDGKWTTAAGGSPAGGEGASSPAMTGLALLTFLAHGETPSSPEFGPTVERGLRWLVDNQTPDGHFAQSDGHEYSLPIATYALCEAYALTKVPMLKDAAQKSVEVIVKGQNSGGLWNYNCQQGNRNDLSYSGWCIQAVKAAAMAGFEVNGLKDCERRAIGGLKGNAGQGGFDYTGPGMSKTLTPVGVLCMQLLGAGKDSQASSPMEGILKTATCDWQNPWTGDPLYCWYYLTQAKFHRGDTDFIPWNKQFAPTLMKSQIIVPKAIADTNGVMVSIGYWPPAANAEKCKAYCYNTTLCALMLTVYYRHLPTYKPPEAGDGDTGFQKEDDIKVNVK